MPAPSVLSTIPSGPVDSGLKSIVESIMMEASEKCEEIDVKCDEEYQVLRRKEISEQGEIIEKADKKRREAVLRDDRVCNTKLINNFRLAQLKAKNDIYNDILKTVKNRVSKDTSTRYQQLLENSLTQAMYMLMEPEVLITCRKKDQNIISSTFPSAVHKYENNTKLRVIIGFSNRTLTDNSSSGGLLVTNKTGTITVNCSLDSRVDHVCYLAMPMIVEMLFAGVPMMKDFPKLSLQRALSPATGDPTCRLLEEQSRMPDKSERSSTMSPPPHSLKEERLGIGTSSLNLLGPIKPTADDHQSEGERHSNDDHQESRSTTKSSAPGSPEPDPDQKRRSTTRSPSHQGSDEQGPSNKKK